MNPSSQKPDPILQSFIEAHTESVITFNVQFSHYIRKISSALHAIEASLLSPDAELDEHILIREKKMNVEFSCRFSRNNLYPIHLKLIKLENEIIIFQSNQCCKISKAVELRTLVLSLFSSLSNSVQVYERFLRKSSIKFVMKLDDLIDHLLSSLQLVSFIVDDSLTEMLDLFEVVSMIKKFSRKLKYESFSTNCSKDKRMHVLSMNDTKLPSRALPPKKGKVIEKNANFQPGNRKHYTNICSKNHYEESNVWETDLMVKVTKNQILSDADRGRLSAFIETFPTMLACVYMKKCGKED